VGDAVDGWPDSAEIGFDFDARSITRPSEKPDTEWSIDVTKAG
jgi:hypothetical protein